MKHVIIVMAITCTIAINPLLFMVCFNAVAPLFWAAAPTLGFFQAFAMVIAARIIFGSNPFGLNLGSEKE